MEQKYVLETEGQHYMGLVIKLAFKNTGWAIAYVSGIKYGCK